MENIRDSSTFEREGSVENRELWNDFSRSMRLSM